MEKSPIQFWLWAKWREKQDRDCVLEDRRCAPVLHEICCVCFEQDIAQRNNMTKETTHAT